MGATTSGGEIMMYTPRRRVTRLMILGLAIGSIATLVRCPGIEEGTLSCSDFSMDLEPGSCRSFSNACHPTGEWVAPPRSDGFRLVGAPASVYVRTERADGITTRSLCSAGDATVVNVSVPFIYGFIGSDRSGTGHLTVTVSPRLAVTASAQPQRINLGEASQLAAQVSRGVPPVLLPLDSRYRAECHQHPHTAGFPGRYDDLHRPHHRLCGRDQ